MTKKRKPWDRPLTSLMPNRPGDRDAEPIFTAIGRAVSAWEGVQVAVLQFYLALTDNREQLRQDDFEKFIDNPKLDLISNMCRDAVQDAVLRLHLLPVSATEFANTLNSAIAAYHGWGQRRNDISHCYVSEAKTPDYDHPDQPMINAYSACPSHARLKKWRDGEPEFNLLAHEIEDFASEFLKLDERFETLARRLDQLNATKHIRGDVKL